MSGPLEWILQVQGLLGKKKKRTGISLEKGKIENKLGELVVPESKEVLETWWGHVTRSQEPT